MHERLRNVVKDLKLESALFGQVKQTWPVWPQEREDALLANGPQHILLAKSCRRRSRDGILHLRFSLGHGEEYDVKRHGASESYKTKKNTPRAQT